MAKKTIISYFSALKGKVTFSEKTPDTKLSAKVSSAPTSKPKDSEKGHRWQILPTISVEGTVRS